MGWKEIDHAALEEWYNRFEDVNTSNDIDKETKLEKLYEDLEHSLEYIGSSAIEDLL